MDRDLLYPGQIGLVENFLDAFKASMVGIGITSEAVLGQSTQVFGLVPSPLSSSSLAGNAFAVSIGRGGIFSYQPTDPNAYGVLGVDTATNILKTGINLTPVEIGIANAAPGTAGQSINYLVSAAFEEMDTNAVNLPFYNAGGSPALTTENATRVQRVVFSVAGGTAATTGSQTTPSAPAGSVPIYVVTVNNGETGVAPGDITVAPGAPFISNLGELASSVVNLSNSLTSEINTRTAEQGNLKNVVAVYSNLTLNASQSGSFVEIAAGGPTWLTLPTPSSVGGGGFFRIINGTNYTQTLQTSTHFYGPGGSGTNTLSLPPGQMVDATSDGASWFMSYFSALMALYTASQSGSIATAPSTSYAIAHTTVIFPSYSLSGAFRVRGHMIAQGTMTGSGTCRQNFCSTLSDGTSVFFTGANWLVTSAYTNDSWGVSDSFESSTTYPPGSSVTFTMSTSTGGGNAAFAISGSSFQLFPVEA